MKLVTIIHIPLSFVCATVTYIFVIKGLTDMLKGGMIPIEKGNPDEYFSLLNLWFSWRTKLIMTSKISILLNFVSLALAIKFNKKWISIILLGITISFLAYWVSDTAMVKQRYF